MRFSILFQNILGNVGPMLSPFALTKAYMQTENPTSKFGNNN